VPEPPTASWGELERAAPQIAGPGRRRLDEAGVALLGTIRRDGSPRISPIEPVFAADELVFGAMAWTAKVRDLARDPRCVVHSAVTGSDSGEGELKLQGRAVEADDGLREACEGAWWAGRPRDLAWVFCLRVASAAYVEWNYAGGEMLVSRWSRPRGPTQRRRPYP
jgi:hypothetical protein